MRNSIDELVRASRAAGGDPLLVQGGGGNTSVKSDEGDRLYVKSSGIRLSEVGPGVGYIELDIAMLRQVLSAADLASMPVLEAQAVFDSRVRKACTSNVGGRPSLEVSFHSMAGRLVLHTHSVYGNAFSCMRGGREALAELAGSHLTWVDYFTPGYDLGSHVLRTCDESLDTTGRCPTTIVMANHGLITTGHSSDDVLERTRVLVEISKRHFGQLAPASIQTQAPPNRLQSWAADLEKHLVGDGSAMTCIRVMKKSVLAWAAQEPELRLSGGALVPDDVVYLGETIWIVEPDSRPERLLADLSHLQPSKLVIAVRGEGVILAATSVGMLSAMEENLLAHVFIRILISARGEPNFISPENVRILTQMESEQYRQRIINRSS